MSEQMQEPGASEENFRARLSAFIQAEVSEVPQRMGRPRLSLHDMVFCMVCKASSAHSTRQFLSSPELRKWVQRVPHFNSLIKYFDDPALTPLLSHLVQKLESRSGEGRGSVLEGQHASSKTVIAQVNESLCQAIGRALQRMALEEERKRQEPPEHLRKQEVEGKVNTRYAPGSLHRYFTTIHVIGPHVGRAEGTFWRWGYVNTYGEGQEVGTLWMNGALHPVRRISPDSWETVDPCLFPSPAPPTLERVPYQTFKQWLGGHREEYPDLYEAVNLSRAWYSWRGAYNLNEALSLFRPHGNIYEGFDQDMRGAWSRWQTEIVLPYSEYKRRRLLSSSNRKLRTV